MQKYKVKFIQLTLWFAFATTFISGQHKRAIENDVTLETDAVFVTSSIPDQATRNPLSDLKRGDGKQTVNKSRRDIFDFSFDGKTNCPLTIILNFNFAPNGALRYLEQPQTPKSVENTTNR